MTVHSLQSPPDLRRLFARAVLTSRGRSGDTIAPTVFETAAAPIDGAHLAAYQRVCGFRIGDVLPSTYLHVVAFPLAVARMVEPDFPFPLIGLVHVANSITQHRPVRLGESVALQVEAGNLRPHPAGHQVDLVASASVDDEHVWTSTSTYLRRGPRTSEHGPRPTPLTGASMVIRVPDDIGRRYAAVAGDRNPIHLHTVTAKAFGFPRAIAHGMWLAARVLAALEGRLPEASTYDVTFKTPVFLPSTVELTTAREGAGWAVDLHNAKSGKPHLNGRVRGLQSA